MQNCQGGSSVWWTIWRAEILLLLEAHMPGSGFLLDYWEVERGW